MQIKKLGVLSAFTMAWLWSVAGCSKVGVAAKPLVAGTRPNILLIVADNGVIVKEGTAK